MKICGVSQPEKSVARVGEHPLRRLLGYSSRHSMKGVEAPILKIRKLLSQAYSLSSSLEQWLDLRTCRMVSHLTPKLKVRRIVSTVPRF